MDAQVDNGTGEPPHVFRLKSKNWHDLTKAIMDASNAIPLDNKLEIEIAFVGTKKHKNSEKKTCFASCCRDMVQKRKNDTKGVPKNSVKNNIRADLDLLLHRMDMLEEQLKLIHDGFTGYSIDEEDDISEEKQSRRKSGESEKTNSNKDGSSETNPKDDRNTEDGNNASSEASEPSANDTSKGSGSKTDSKKTNNEVDHHYTEAVREIAEKEKSTRFTVNTEQETNQWDEHMTQLKEENSEGTDGSSDYSDKKGKEGTNVFMVQTNADFPHNYINKVSPEYEKLYTTADWKLENRPENKYTHDQGLDMKNLFLPDGNNQFTKVSNNKEETEDSALKKGRKQIKYKLSRFTHRYNKNYANIYNVLSTSSILSLNGPQSKDNNQINDQNESAEIQNQILSTPDRILAKGDCSEDKLIPVRNCNTDNLLSGQLNAQQTSSSISSESIPRDICAFVPSPFSSVEASGSEDDHFIKQKSQPHLHNRTSQSKLINASASLTEPDDSSHLISTASQQLIMLSDLLNNQTIELITQDLRSTLVQQMLNTWEQCLSQINEIVDNKTVTKDSPLE